MVVWQYLQELLHEFGGQVKGTLSPDQLLHRYHQPQRHLSMTQCEQVVLGPAQAKKTNPFIIIPSEKTLKITQTHAKETATEEKPGDAESKETHTKNVTKQKEN